ncbi:MAG: hypothetical protein AB1546_08340, partial [bacterium]
MKNNFKLEANIPFKILLLILLAAALAFTYFFFATPLDRIFSERITGRLAFLFLVPTFFSFILLFIWGLILLVRNVKASRLAWILLIVLLVSHLMIKLTVLEKSPLRPVDEADMVLKGKYVWNLILQQMIHGEKELYYPFRPHGHSLIIKTGGFFTPLTINTAINVNIFASTMIIFVVFLLSNVLFAREWLSILCALFTAVNPIFGLFSLSADYSISALFYSLTADLFIAAYLRRGVRLFLLTGLVSLVLAMQSRPEYIMYPLVVLAYLFVMARREENGFLTPSLLIFLLAVPHFLMTCFFLKNHPVPNFINDPANFVDESSFMAILTMARENLRGFPNWLKNNGTSSLLYVFSLIGIIEGIRRYRVQAFILILPVIVLFIGILIGNTRSFITITYSINFQPYLCILSAIGIFSFARPLGAVNFNKIIVVSSVILSIVSSVWLYSQLRTEYPEKNYAPQNVPKSVIAPCIISEMNFLNKAGASLNKHCMAIEKIQGFFEAAAGIKTFAVDNRVYYERYPCLYFYEGLGSLYERVKAEIPPERIEGMKKRYRLRLVNSATICDEKVGIYL